MQIVDTVDSINQTLRCSDLSKSRFRFKDRFKIVKCCLSTLSGDPKTTEIDLSAGTPAPDVRDCSERTCRVFQKV